jgi:hypothetical protein
MQDASYLRSQVELCLRPGSSNWLKGFNTTPAAASLKLLTLVQPRAAVVKICAVKRGNVTPARLLFWGRNRYMIE